MNCPHNYPGPDCPACRRGITSPQPDPDWSPTDHAREAPARDEAIQRGDRHSNSLWQFVAYQCLRELCRDRDTFRAEELLPMIEARFLSTHDYRALGAVMRRGQKEGLCEPTGDFDQSRRKGRHLGPVRIWRSLIAEQLVLL